MVSPLSAIVKTTACVRTDEADNLRVSKLLLPLPLATTTTTGKLRTEEIVTDEEFLEGFKAVLETVEDSRLDVPRIDQYIGTYAARAVEAGFMEPKTVYSLLSGMGFGSPFLFYTLPFSPQAQTLHTPFQVSQLVCGLLMGFQYVLWCRACAPS